MSEPPIEQYMLGRLESFFIMDCPCSEKLLFIIFSSNYTKRGFLMAYYGSKGWYVKKLREMGITKHPIERRKLKLYKTFVLRNLYFRFTQETDETS
ncbi:YflJ family protein [Metabacillus idriensis]|uniref:YflJ family protein n=1 Tax=Metabacillus idriensis TaxID=324768 RepID=UPI002812A24D|nr:YflJ family protein [Metabacillus idriensis]MDR0137479.1 YflJ family protein [Metabacillus idriensis]